LDLYSLRIDEGMSMHNHLSKFNRLMMQVVNVGEKTENEEQSLLLLSSLHVMQVVGTNNESWKYNFGSK
jgi:type II secretory pathway component PulF